MSPGGRVMAGASLLERRTRRKFASDEEAEGSVTRSWKWNSAPGWSGGVPARVAWPFPESASEAQAGPATSSMRKPSAPSGSEARIPACIGAPARAWEGRGETNEGAWFGDGLTRWMLTLLDELAASHPSWTEK